MQYGVQMYLHEVGGGADNVDWILDYVVGLGANSFAVSFRNLHRRAPTDAGVHLRRDPLAGTRR
jgi:hypothetical protein